MASSSPVTHQTLGQQGGTGEDGHSHLVDWTLSVVVIEKKKEASCDSVQTQLNSWTESLVRKWTARNLAQVFHPVGGHFWDRTLHSVSPTPPVRFLLESGCIHSVQQHSSEQFWRMDVLCIKKQTIKWTFLLILSLFLWGGAVSYTHLRAHETA